VPLAPNITCADSDCATYNVAPYVRTRSRYGIGCMGNPTPGHTPNPDPPPQSYAVADIDKPGFPALAPPEREMVQRIQRYVHSRTLRFAWLAPPGQRVKAEFVVFDATAGPCEVAAGGYPVLNGDCNEYYQPGENPYFTHAGAGGCPLMPKRPWMTTEWPNVGD
jgi:hypothetical protein